MGFQAFQQVTITDQDDFINQLETFLTANGWTSNDNSTFGNGLRLHLQKTGSEVVHSDLFVNLRSSEPGEVHFTDGNRLMHIGVNMSETFVLADDPMRQGESTTPLYPRDTAGAGQSKGAGINHQDVTGVIPFILNQTCFMFVFDLPDLVVCYFEYSPGRFNFLYFGEMKKTATYTGGQIFGASKSYEETLIDGDGQNVPRFFDDTNDHPNNFVRVDFDTVVDRWSQNHNVQSGVAGTAQVLMGRHFNALLQDATPNAFNGKAPLITSYAFQRRAGNIQQSHLGFLEHVRHINIENLVAKQQFTVGTSDWQVFPFRAKGAIVTGQFDDTLSGNRAVAIRRN